jgi:type I restriction enzyme S subunit
MKSHRIAGSADHITTEAIEKSAATLIPAGSVLVVTRSGILERTLPVAVTEVDVTFNQDLKALTPTREIGASYVAYALCAFEREILHECSKSGTTVASIEFPKLQAFSIPVAPPREQERIVSEIEKQFTRLDAGVESLKRLQAHLRRYRATVLVAATEGRLVPTEADLARGQRRGYEHANDLLERVLAERRVVLARSKYRDPDPPAAKGLPVLPEGWVWTTVESVGDVLLGRRRAPEYQNSPHARPYLRVANVKDDRLDLSDVLMMNWDDGDVDKYALRAGDILVSEGQSPELVGQSAIYNGAIKGLCFQATLHRFRPLPSGPSSKFAQLVFRAHVRTGVFRGKSSITTNIAHLTLEKFKAAPFPLPPLAEQARIVERAELLLSAADQAEALIATQLQRAKTLRSAILREAFNGRLVPATSTLAKRRASA